MMFVLLSKLRPRHDLAPMPASFHAFSTSHQIVLMLTVLAIIGLAISRWKNLPIAPVLERLLGTTLLLTWPLAVWVYWSHGTLEANNALPCHFCDIAAISGGIALWTRNRLACEIVYFFGLAGTLQGLLTPNLEVDFPHPRFLVFFLLHAGVVVTALHVMMALTCPPRPGALRRMFGVTMLYTVTIAAINAALGTNYGFLCHKPAQASLMDQLGPWPWYVGSLILLCVLFYSLLYLPFFIAHRRQTKR